MCSSTTPFVAHWGIIGTGWIASMFVKDLCIQRDGVLDVSHSITAVGAREKIKSTAFIKEHCPQGGPAQTSGLVNGAPEAFGSYSEVYQHQDVNIVYIGTVNTSHYTEAKAALEAGKSVLVEKPACLNVAEWDSLVSIAKTRKLFLMEDLLFRKKAIGEVKFVNANFSQAFNGFVPDTHRNLSPQLAGGAMFDLGPYTVLAALLALYHHPDNLRQNPVDIRGSMIKHHTGVDLTTTITLNFPKIQASAVLTCSFNNVSPKDERCVIIGTKGELVINDGLSRITKMTLKSFDQELGPRIVKYKDSEWVKMSVGGAYTEDSELENARMPHDESRLVLEIFDIVRAQNNFILPEGVEKLR